MTVTALISAYYAERFLAGRIENLLEQKPIPEMVVVCQIASQEERIARNYPVRVIVTPDIPTISEAWNIAIRAASGDYCCIANTDDTWDNQGIQKMTAILNDNPDVGLVWGDVLYIKDGKTFANPDRGHIGRGGRVGNIAKMLSERYFIGNMPMWRRSLHAQHGYFDEGYEIACDYDWCLRLARAGVVFYYLPEIVGIYDLRKDGLEKRNQNLCAHESRTIRGAI